MSYDPKNATLEERVAELEAKCEKQGKQIGMMVAVFRTVNLSAFDSPLKRFFDGPQILDFFFDVEEEIRCREDCGEIFQKALDAAGNDEDKRDAALSVLSECLRNC